MKHALVTGAAGFIGSHMAQYLLLKGYAVVGVDWSNVWPKWIAPLGTGSRLVKLVGDLRNRVCVSQVFSQHRTFDEVYHFAADMGGIGYITQHHATIFRNNAAIDMNMLEAARVFDVGRFLYASSACVYAQRRQMLPGEAHLAEEDAWPADPEPGYGLEKLLTEEACKYYHEQYGLNVRVARFHNIYGPGGAFEGGREKAPAALCRKAAVAKDGDAIEVWGDGLQTRSFLYVDDAVEGIYRLMQSGYVKPLNLGTNREVTIDELARIVIAASGKKLSIQHVTGPQGVRARNADLKRMKTVLKWEPQVSLEDGIRATYDYIDAASIEEA